MQTHLFTYRHEGKLWSLEIKANDEEDAKDRLKRLAFASYQGVLVANVPLFLGPLVPLAVWIRNATTTLLPRFGQGRHG
jgi:hypothetical protein